SLTTSVSIPTSLPPLTTPFPYTTLFRSRRGEGPPPPEQGHAPAARAGARRRRADRADGSRPRPPRVGPSPRARSRGPARAERRRSEEHTSELQSRGHLVCRLLLEKKK